jgi:hypothetical protein
MSADYDFIRSVFGARRVACEQAKRLSERRTRTFYLSRGAATDAAFDPAHCLAKTSINRRRKRGRQQIHPDSWSPLVLAKKQLVKELTGFLPKLVFYA